MDPITWALIRWHCMLANSLIVKLVRELRRFTKRRPLSLTMLTRPHRCLILLEPVMCIRAYPTRQSLYLKSAWLCSKVGSELFVHQVVWQLFILASRLYVVPVVILSRLGPCMVVRITCSVTPCHVLVSKQPLLIHATLKPSPRRFVLKPVWSSLR